MKNITRIYRQRGKNYPRRSALVLFSCILAMTLTFQKAEAYAIYQNFTLNIENKTVGEVLSELESKSQYKFFYKSGDIDLSRKVSLKVEDAPIEDVLVEIFKDGSVTISAVKNQIVLKKTKKIDSKTRNSSSKTEPIMEDPELMISGTVKDADGTGIPGVNIIEKGTTNGVVTSSDGTFNLSVEGSNSILVFSYIGYAKQEVSVGNRTTFDITLAEDITALSEIIVIGYASQNAQDLSGSVSTLGSKDISNLPGTSVAEIMQGRVAGVQVVKSSGGPGATSDIVIRGGGSVNGMPPLFIVDGVRMGTDYTFNNQDIQSIEILKDASAAAIYGAQAAGGVVLITTKRGSSSKEKIDVNVSAYTGSRNVRPLIPLMNTQQMFEAREAFGYDVSAWGNPSSLPDVNWIDELYKTGSDKNVTISLSGASDKNNYYISGNIFKQDGIKLDNTFERFSFRTNSDFKITDKIKVGETVYLYKSNYNPDQGGNFWRTVPTMNVKEADGSWGKAPSAGYYNGNNPAMLAYINHGSTDEFAIQGNVYADFQIMDALSIRGTVGTDIGSSATSNFSEDYNIGSQSAPATLTQNYMNWENYTANAVLTYARSFGASNAHDLKALAGYEMFRADLTSVDLSAVGFATSVTDSYYLNNDVTSQRVLGGPNPVQRLLSQFGRVNYSYNDKYLFSATVRRDGSDRFGPENKWGVFPAFSAGWRISEESFFNSGVISSMQIRASYGALGNIGAIPQFLYQTSYSPQNFHGLADGTPVQSLSRALELANAQIKWEEVKTTDIGLDIGLLDQRLTLTLDWYNRLTTDMIYALPLPLSSGYVGGRRDASNPVFTNIGELSNTGLEFGVNYEYEIGELRLNAGLTGAFNKNEVVSLDGSGTKAINDGFGGQYLSNPISRTAEGQPMSMFYGYVVEGIYATDQEAIDRGVTQTGAGAGDLIYKDIDDDGIITQDDRDFIGNPWPKLTYGLNLSMTYKGFDLLLAFQGVSGMDIYNANRHYSEFLAGDYNSSPEVFNASFFNGNGLTDVPRLGYTDTNGDYQRDPNANYTKISSYFVEDGSYLKLRNLQVGYNFPAALLSNIKATGLRVYLMADNILTFTKYKGVDPEVLGEGTVVNRGIDFNSGYPQTTFVSLGFNLDF